MNVIARVRQALHRGRPETEGQRETARETGVMLGLMADATAAGGDMTDEQRMMLARAAPGMRAREAMLLQIPNRSLIEENELLMIRREMARIEGRDAPAPTRIRGFMGAAPALLGGVKLWMILTAGWALTGGWAVLQMGLKERIEDQRDEARALARQNYAAAQRWQERAEEYREGLVDAAQVARHAADALEAERQRQARAAARERRRQREIQDVLTGSPDAPDWRLRNAGEAEGSGPAAPGR